MTQQDDITQRGLTAEHHLNELMRLTQPWPSATIPCATVRSHVEQALSKLRAPVAEQKPIKLSDDVLQFLKDGVADATQCEESDVDQAFADQLLLLMHTPLYTEPPPKQRAVDWGPLVVPPVADESAQDVDLPWLRAYMHHQIASDRWVVTAEQAKDFARAAVLADRKARAALASAPLAGEAQEAAASVEPYGWICKRYVGVSLDGQAMYSNPSFTRERPYSTDRTIVELYAAPQASECECSRKSKAVSDSEAQL